MNGVSYFVPDAVISTATPLQGEVCLGEREEFEPSDIQGTTYNLKWDMTTISLLNAQTIDMIYDKEFMAKFHSLADTWKSDTFNLSSIEQIVLHPNYQEIIGMGSRVIRLVLCELEREPYFWFWALRSLTGANPVSENMHGDLMAMTNAWLDWGRQHEYI